MDLRIATVAQGIASLLTRIVLFFFIRVEICGLENLRDLKTNVIFASNHPSDIDSVIIRNALPFFSRFAPLIAVARRYKDYAWTGWKSFVYRDRFFKLLGAFPTSHGVHDYKKSLAGIIHAASKGYSILIFSGGKQSERTEPMQVHGGTGYLVWATNSPVVPVAIEGTYGFSPKNILKRRHIIVRFGTPRTKEELFAESEPTVEACRQGSLAIVEDIERMRISLRSEIENHACPKVVNSVSRHREGIFRWKF